MKPKKQKSQKEPALSNTARGLLLLAAEKIRSTNLYNQDCTAWLTPDDHVCSSRDSAYCIVGWMNYLASRMGMSDNGLTQHQRDVLYWYRRWPAQFKKVPDGKDTKHVKVEDCLARIEFFLRYRR